MGVAELKFRRRKRRVRIIMVAMDLERQVLNLNGYQLCG